MTKELDMWKHCAKRWQEIAVNWSRENAKLKELLAECKSFLKDLDQYQTDIACCTQSQQQITDLCKRIYDALTNKGEKK